MTWLAGTIVVLTGLWLIGLAIAIVVAPVRAKRFLEGFAASRRAHYCEQVLRLIAGLAIVVFAAEMRFPLLFTVFGWVLIATACVLLLLPWQWHRRFGEWAIPLVLRHITLYALGALALGGLLLYAVWS